MICEIYYMKAGNMINECKMHARLEEDGTLLTEGLQTEGFE